MVRLSILILETLCFVFINLFKSQKDLLMENRLLRIQLAQFQQKHIKPKITNGDRLLWIIISKFFKYWESALEFVSPETVVNWHRKGFRYYWDRLSNKHNKPGRPMKNKELRDLIRQMAFDNITWGAPRIHGELLKLGLDASERTVSRYMPKRKQSLDKIKQWKKFLKNQAKGTWAMDFFTVPTLSFRQRYGFFIISHDRRHLESAFEKFGLPKFLLFDRGSYYSRFLIQSLKNLGIKPVQTSFRSPWQNGIAERWVGNIRKDVLDHVIIFNKNHLLKLIEEYADYYNNDRTHYNLNKDSPSGREILHKPDHYSKIISLPRCCGLHHKYIWKKSA